MFALFCRTPKEASKVDYFRGGYSGPYIDDLGNHAIGCLYPINDGGEVWEEEHFPLFSYNVKKQDYDVELLRMHEAMTRASRNNSGNPAHDAHASLSLIEGYGVWVNPV